MNFWLALCVVWALHVMVNAWLQPRIEARWEAASATRRVAKATLVALLQTAGDFLRIAAIVFSLVAGVFVIVQLVAPTATVAVLSSLQGGAFVILEWARSLGSILGQVVFWIALAGAFLIGWALTTHRYQRDLAVEYYRQLRALLGQERDGTLAPLAANARMIELAEDFAAREDSLAPGEAQRLRHAIRYHDLTRRIDLSGRSLPLLAEGVPGRLLRLVFSQGTHDHGKETTQRLGKVGFAASCVLVVGVGVPAIEADVIEPALVRMTDLRIERELAASADRLEALAAQPPVERRADDPDYDLVAESFIDALADSDAWTAASVQVAGRAAISAADTRRADRRFRSVIARDTVARSFAGDPGTRTRAIAFDDLPSDAPEKIVLEDMRAGGPAPLELRRAASQRLAATFRKAGQAVPGFREKLAETLKSFDRPAKLSTYAKAAVSNEVMAAIGDAFPGPGGRTVFAAAADRAGRRGVKKGLEQLVEIRFASFLNDIVAGRPLDTALGRARGGDLAKLVRPRDARSIARIMDSARSGQRKVVESARARPPVLMGSVGAGRVKLAEAVVGKGEWKPVANLVMRYDDLLPGTTVALPTALRIAAARKGMADPTRIARLRALGPRAIKKPPKVRPRGFSLVGLAVTAASVAATVDQLNGGLDVARVPGIRLDHYPPKPAARMARLAWRIDEEGLHLESFDAPDGLLPQAAIDPAVARAALAFAADGRPMALIASRREPLPFVTWLPHPVLESSTVAGDLIKAYRMATTPGPARIPTSDGSIDARAMVVQAEALRLRPDTVAFLRLVPVFRAILKDLTNIPPERMAQLARDLEPFRMERVRVPRSSLLVVKGENRSAPAAP